MGALPVGTFTAASRHGKHLAKSRARLTFGLISLICAGALPAPPAAAQVEQLEARDAALIRAGDIVRLSVWREEALSGEFPVNQFGRVVLPMVGEYDVSGETARSFRERVMSDLRERIVNPSIEVVVLKRVRVLGEVNEPGVYALDPTLTVADALAMAKGNTPLAQAGKVVLRRGGEVVTSDIRVETRISDTPIRSGDELLVPQRGWFDRNTGAVIGGASALIGIVITLIVNDSGGG